MRGDEGDHEEEYDRSESDPEFDFDFGLELTEYHLELEVLGAEVWVEGEFQ